MFGVSRYTARPGFPSAMPGTLLAFCICSGYSSIAMSDRNAAIRALIEHRFPDATPVTHRTAEPVATGIDALDAILPGRGLPRGRLTVWMPQGGATAVLRACLLYTSPSP